MSPESNTVKGSGPCEKRNRPGSGFLTGSGSGPCPGSRSRYQDGGLRLLRARRVELAGGALKKKGLHGGVAQKQRTSETEGCSVHAHAESPHCPQRVATVGLGAGQTHPRSGGSRDTGVLI